MYLDQIRIYNRREHACTVPVSFRYEATALLIRVHTASVFLQIWLQRVHISPPFSTRVHIVYV